MARAGGDARVLHSLPNYYGMTAAMFAAVPALGVMVIWLLAQPMLIQNAVVPLLPAAATETAGTTSLVLSDVNRVAGGLTLAIEQGVLDAPAIAALRDEAHAALSILDSHLAQQAYVCGDRFTMGDIPLGCVAYRYFNVDLDRPALPNVEAWYQRLAERPAYQDHVMRHFGSNPDEWAALEVACASEGVI